MCIGETSKQSKPCFQSNHWMRFSGAMAFQKRNLINPTKYSSQQTTFLINPSEVSMDYYAVE